MSENAKLPTGKRVASTLALAVFLLFFGGGAFALESDAVTSPRAHVTVITDADSVQPGKSFSIGLRFQLTDGWHVYWLNPGDAGQPPAIHLHAPDGVTNSGIEWPTPVRMREGPAMVFAYTGDMTLPVQVTVPPSFKDSALKLGIDADWLVCADHCVPEKGHFELSIPVGMEKASAEAPLIEASLARIPRVSPFDIHMTDKAMLVVKGDGLSTQTVQDAWFFPDTWGVIDHAAPQTLVAGSNEISLKLKPGALFKTDAPASGILVLKDAGGDESFYNVTALPTVAALGWGEWARMLLFALLGGLILNLMPCVFPVLAIKAISILSLSNSERKHVRTQSLFYTLGVLVAFTVIALIVMAFQAAGKVVGWGFQFQSPIFVTFMAWLLFAIGLNLSGVYIFGARVMGIGESYAGKKGATGSFFTGLLAVIVATPCVAPFLGAAIATALTSSPVGMLAIFLVMGLGLALPYALLTLFPKAMRVLPRPGAWMEVLKQGLAFPMYGASAWLLWVLSQQDGSQGLAYALTGIILLGLAGWIYGQVKSHRKRGRIIRNVCMVVPLVIAFAILCRIGEMPAATSAVSAQGMKNEPYTEARLAELQASDQPVFVDMTAAWCITCLVNEHVAIASDDVQAAFARNHIAYMKGDWTQQDPAITRFLQQHGSDGVPLYVFYPAHHGKPTVLPQILTPSIVLSAVNHPQPQGD